MRRVHHAALAALLAGAMCPSVLGGAPDADAIPTAAPPPVSVELEWGRGDWKLRGVLHGLGEEMLVVRIDAFGTTHNLVVDPNDPWVTAGQDVTLTDPCLRPDREGEHQVAVEVRTHTGEPGKDRVLLKTTVTVDVRKLDDEEFEEQLDKARLRLTGDEAKGEWEFYANGVVHSEDGNGATRPVSEQGHRYQKQRHWSFMERVQAYADLALTLEGQLRPGDARTALDTARDIFQEGREIPVATPHNQAIPLARSPSYFTWAPGHFQGYAWFHGRNGDAENALKWLHEMEKWYEAERTRGELPREDRVDAKDQLANTYREIAHMAVLLNQDWARYDDAMEKFRTFLSEGARRTPPYWAEGVSRTAAGSMFD